MSRQADFDLEMMERCIGLSKTAAALGEYPFSALITRETSIVAEMPNRVARDADVTRHAELVAIAEAQKQFGTSNLAGCSLYCSVEPCVMCSFPIRETRISRVVFAIKSGLMGGKSRWNVLTDPLLSERLPEYFGSPPQIIEGLLANTAEDVWKTWNPDVWRAFQERGMFGGHDRSRSL